MIDATDATSVATHPEVSERSLVRLRKIILCVHALCWVDVTPADLEAGGKMGSMGEHWPGRSEGCHTLDLTLQERLRQRIDSLGEDEGVFFLPTDRAAGNELIERARQHLGPRCVVCRLDSRTDRNRDVLGEAFVAGLEDDRRRAIVNRGPQLQQPWGAHTQQIEWEAWEHSKAWGIDLMRQLNDQGFTFDPAAVEFEVWGENWVGCTATYACHLGRVFGLPKPMVRRFDMINPDWSSMLLQATVVEQDLPMPENVRLFIFKTAHEGPKWGNYIAQYWEGIHGYMDRPHVVNVDFPPDKVIEVDLFGWEIGRARGSVGPKYDRYGSMRMAAGCGAHTPHHSTIAMAERGLSLEAFRAALLTGRVVEKV